MSAASEFEAFLVEQINVNAPLDEDKDSKATRKAIKRRIFIAILQAVSPEHEALKAPENIKLLPLEVIATVDAINDLLQKIGGERLKGLNPNKTFLALALDDTLPDSFVVIPAPK